MFRLLLLDRGVNFVAIATMEPELEPTTTKVDESSPLLKYATKVEKTGKGGGSTQVLCLVCGSTYQGTYTRVKAHLLEIKGKGVGPCQDVGVVLMRELKMLDEEAEKRKGRKELNKVPLPTESTDPSLKKRKENPISSLYNVSERSILDAEISRMFFTGGLPFNLARNPHYLSSFKYAANHNLTGYVPPSYNRLRTVLLQQEVDNIKILLQPIKATWREKGVTIVSGGWSDPQRMPLINFMATSGSGPIFIKAVNCFGEYKDNYFIADLLRKVIDEVGPMNVVQVITDNAANCKVAGEIIESSYPWIYWTPCVVHTLNLALKNICAARNLDNQKTYDECHWITKVHDDAVQVKNFIMTHNMGLAMFNKFCSLKLLAIAETRFASVVVMLRRFKLLRRSLETMVVSEEWETYREDDQAKARYVKEKVTSDEWWDKVDYILAFTGPMYDMIRLCDTDKTTLHLVYEIWDTMIEKESTFSYKSGAYTGGENFYCRSNMDPLMWWASFGAATPMLQALALRVLGQPTFSSCCQRNWSIYNFIHSLRRNRLTPQRAEELVRVHNNLRLLSRKTDEYKDEKTKMWDVGGYQFDNMEEGGSLEFAEISLDEPELEAYFCSNEITRNNQKLSLCFSQMI
ncbi:uncharacterized protein [Spinacia oleracea]|uniref:DUF659 domain-containing protein n=1 Tax=Spinacia oleracea TaxID=3562 RepID=A0ABM3R987_SPIOL|nr:uncharacterized protein LOC110790080 [Spinacia oleracea]